MGSTFAFRTGFEHGRRKNALAEEINRSPTANRESVIIDNYKKNKGGTKRSGREGSCEWRHPGLIQGSL